MIEQYGTTHKFSGEFLWEDTYGDVGYIIVENNVVTEEDAMKSYSRRVHDKRKMDEVFRYIRYGVKDSHATNNANELKLEKLREDVEKTFQVEMQLLKRAKTVLEEKAKIAFGVGIGKIGLKKTDIHTEKFKKKDSLHELMTLLFEEKKNLYVPVAIMEGWDIFDDEEDYIGADFGIPDEDYAVMKEWIKKNVVVKTSKATMVARCIKRNEDDEETDFKFEDDETPDIEDCDAVPFRNGKTWEDIFRPDCVEYDDGRIDHGNSDTTYEKIVLSVDVYIITFIPTTL